MAPGKQKQAEVWLDSLEPGRVCKTRTILPASIGKDLLEKSKAREPLSDKREVQDTDTSITDGTPNYQWDRWKYG